ncbi:hypothetical protein AMATHDRAFT_66404, partial [Amanita thiersii Skay4041]
MNPPPTQETLATLRYRIDIYFEHLGRLLAIREQPFLPQPFPNDATRLPAGFQDIEFVYNTYIYWTDRSKLPQLYEVKLCHFNPSPGEPFLTWEIVIRRSGANEPRFQIGLLEINKVLYGDHKLFRFNENFILETIRMSVRLATPIRITKNVLTYQVSSFPGQPSLEVVEMCDAHGHVLHELARQEKLSS